MYCGYLLGVPLYIASNEYFQERRGSGGDGGVEVRKTMNLNPHLPKAILVVVYSHEVD